MRLVDVAGRYEGSGDGSESGPFDATIEIVPLLVAYGAERSAPDRNGNTAAEIARSADHTEIAEYLEGAGDS